MGYFGRLLQVFRALENAPSPPSEYQFGNWISYEVTSVGLRIARPVNWQVRSNVPGVIACFSKGGEAQLIIACEPVPAGKSLSDARQDVRTQIISSGGKITHEESLSLKDERSTPAYRIDFLMGGMVRTLTGFIHNGMVFSVDGSTDAPRFPTYQLVFNHFVNSIRWINGGRA